MKLSDGIRCVLVLTAVVVAGASATPAPGERAGGSDCWPYCPDGVDAGPGTCPEGEICSPDTPYGLYFGGAPLGDDWWSAVGPPEVTAVGGTQTIAVFSNSNADPLTLPFDAAAGDDALEVTAAPPVAIVGAESATTGTYLRILEPGTDLLYDRIRLRADAVASMALVPAGSFAMTDYDLNEEPEVGMALLAGGVSEVTVALESAFGERLVDEEMTVEMPPGYARDAERWDVIVAEPEAAGEDTIVVTAGTAAPTSMALRVVEAVDEIRWVRSMISYREPDSAVIGQQFNFCFRGMNQGDMVLGLSWSFGCSAKIEVVPMDDYPSCVSVMGLSEGTASLVVTAGGLPVYYSLDVIEARSRPVEPAAQSASEPPRASAGVRASL